MKYIIWDRKRFTEVFSESEALSVEKAMHRLDGEIIDTVPGELSEIVKQSGELDSFLIVGGDNLFPLGRVDNPARDSDEFIWTDNTYGSTDDDTLLPERVIGRLPDGKNPGLLIKQLHSIKQESRRFTETLGLTAAVWEKASKNVYRLISDARILVSPPVNYRALNIDENNEVLYFNLHGSKSSNKWYGQKNGTYPVAITPENIPELDGAVVFSEACYGGYTIDKSVDESMALSFLDMGVNCFVGSSTIAYGPPEPPAREADLMAFLFFKEVLKGEKFGRALMEAKHEFFRIMLDEQGFLDGNDRKTLLQFLLYGDPDGIIP